MAITSHKITLEFAISLDVEAPADLGDRLATELVDWNDGRYGFNTELIHTGLANIVREVVKDASGRQVHVMVDGESVNVVTAKIED